MINPLKKFRLKAIAFAMALLLLLGSFAVLPSYAQDDFYFDSWDDDAWTTVQEDSYSYGTGTDVELEGLAALGIIFGIWGIVFIPMYIYFALSLMTIAKKLNVPNAWLAWIPIANFVIFFQCAGLSPWLTILMLIPFLNIIGLIFMIYGYMKIAERRGFESWIGILVIVPVIGIAIPGYLAWAEAKGKTA